MKPFLILNFKTYPETTGANALKRALLCKKISNKKVQIAVAPSLLDLQSVSKIGIKTVAQAIDPLESGQHTGSVPASGVKSCGAIGTFINHSEKKLSLQDVNACIRLARENKLLSFCFAANENELAAIAGMKPDFLVIEPPELIATRSVTEAAPELVKDAVETVRKIDAKIPVLCGAGISNGNDVRTALKLGTQGVILASAFAKAKNPLAILKDLASGFD